MQLLRYDDPRSPIQRARRQELVKFANAKGLNEVTEAWPADVIRKKLLERGLTNIPVPERPLGSYVEKGGETVTDGGPMIDAVADLERQFTEQQKAVSSLGMNELRAECKKRGIKMARTDNLDSLRKKLNGE